MARSVRPKDPNGTLSGVRHPCREEIVLRRHRAVVAVAAAATALTTVMATMATAAVPTDTSALREAVTADAIMDHLAELQKIADNNGDTRASGTPGYGLSIDYIEGL